METSIEPVERYNPLALIEKALERGIDAEQLGKLMDLQERWTKQRAIEAFNRDMNLCQKEMPCVVRDAQNQHTRSKFARLETVQAIARPVYSRFGFSLMFGTEDCPLAEHVRVVCDVQHVDGHSQRYRADIPLDGKGAKGGTSSMNAPQATGSTYSYAQRYLIKLIFNLTIADEDNDAQGRAELTEQEVKTIYSLIDECADVGNPVDKPRFLKWLGVENIEVMPRRDFAKAVAELTKKRTNPCNATNTNNTAPNGGKSAEASPPPANLGTSSRPKR